MKIPKDIIKFFERQNFTVISTVDKENMPHNSCKGILKIKEDGQVYLLDLYMAKTYKNLMHNPAITITAVDEHTFTGFSLRGYAQIVEEGDIDADLLEGWESHISRRITQRLIRNVRGEKGHASHPESLLPKPKYMIVVKVKDIIDLTPQHIKDI